LLSLAGGAARSNRLSTNKEAEMKRFIAILAVLTLAPWSNVMAQKGPTLLLKYEPELAERLAVALAADRDAPSEYWIGLEVAVPEDSQREKLKLPKDQPADQGLIVQQVVPDAPGDKAGIKVGDLLMKLGDKPLKSLSDPLDAIRDAKDSKLLLTFVRDGKTFEVMVKPTKRPDGFGLHGPEPKNEVAKLDSLPAKPTFAPSADLQRIRAELAEIQQRIAIVNRQLAELQTSQANPDREKIIRQIAALKRAAAELAEVGRTEDAERLRQEIRKLSEQMKALGESGGGDAALKGAMLAPQPTRSLATLDSRDAESATQRAMAFLQRAQTEVPAAVPPEVRRAMVVQRAEPDGASIADLRKQVEQLRAELTELRETVKKSKAERN
jgi:membrane-associated protease RseP (regulator of RpoE activity)